MITTDPRLDGLSPKGNEPPQGGGANPYPKILGIHNSGGPRFYNRTRVHSVNGIEINSVPPIGYPSGSAAKVIRTFQPISETL
ncbi:hypothetical protein PIB30_009211 [Stylosanthes scabra]|uniref:Uncharacterized protein n=1 Tax=Stylosanthes scabra TaxID=79078 RepID=A0ABU6Z5U4_9FABA|nr:hypothetical protein [Stylosanthes scabra]